MSKSRIITDQYCLWSYFRMQVISAMCLCCLVYCHLAIYTISAVWLRSNHKALSFLAVDDKHFIFLNKTEFQLKLFTSVNTVSAICRWIKCLVIKPLPHRCTQEDTRRPTTEQNITYSQESATISHHLERQSAENKVCRWFKHVWFALLASFASVQNSPVNVAVSEHRQVKTGWYLRMQPDLTEIHQMTTTSWAGTRW